MKRALVDGALIQCNQCPDPGRLTVSSASRMAVDRSPVATIKDHGVGSIPSFGICALTQAKCEPAVVTPWLGERANFSMDGVPLLKEDSTCVCQVGGLIRPLRAGQVVVNVDVESPKADVEGSAFTRVGLRTETGPWRAEGTGASLAPTNAGLLGVFRDVPIVSVKVLKVTFESDHQEIRDNNADLKNSGKTYSKPEWAFGQPSKAISVSKGKPIEIEVEFEVEPRNASPPLTASHIVEGKGLGLAFEGQQRISGGKEDVKVTSRKLWLPAPDSVAKLTGDLAWAVHDGYGGTKKAGGASFNAGASWGHTVFVTFDNPEDAGWYEEGITHRRMEQAIDLISATGSNDPFEIVRSLMALFPGYVLTKNPALADVRHPNYMNNVGGAWRLIEHMSEGAECQAIVRLVRAVMLMVGCPGKFEAVAVHADPDEDGGQKAVETPLRKYKEIHKRVNGEDWIAALMDGPVEVGKVYTSNQVGQNNYEACLKMTANSSSGVQHTKYYGGGTGGKTYHNADSVLKRCFWGLCWISTSAEGGYLVREVVTRYT